MPLPDVCVRIYDADDGDARDADRRGGRDLLRGAAADDRLLEPARRNREPSFATTRTRSARAAGCTPATSAISMQDGYVFIVDRKKDLIKTSGFQVWPREIEEALSAHPAVAEVGVAGVPDDVKGRSGAGLGRAAAWSAPQPKPSCASFRRKVLAPLQGAVPTSNSGRICPRRSSARFFGAPSETGPPKPFGIFGLAGVSRFHPVFRING